MTELYLLCGLVGLTIGVWLGAWLEAKQWQAKGNHPYMNRKESGGALYQVRREGSNG